VIRHYQTIQEEDRIAHGSGSGNIGADSPFVYVDDLDAHLKHTEAAGASIVSPITEHGFRSYTAAAGEGCHWVFAQSGPRLGR
jgi:predicted enzyme related to lactoylglutathione lyase